MRKRAVFALLAFVMMVSAGVLLMMKEDKREIVFVSPSSVFVAWGRGTDRVAFSEDASRFSVGLFNSPHLSVWAAQEVYEIDKWWTRDLHLYPHQFPTSRCVRLLDGEYECQEIGNFWDLPGATQEALQGVIAEGRKRSKISGVYPVRFPF